MSLNLRFPEAFGSRYPGVIVALYEIRNNRNVGHVGGDIDPNYMDAVSVLTMSRWILAELVRLFHGMSVDEAEVVVEALTARDVPAIWEVGNKRRVLIPDLNTRDETLLLLYASPTAVPTGNLLDWLEYGNASRFRTAILRDLHKKRLIEYDTNMKTVELSPTGIAYVEANLPLHVT